ncbi:MAG TPA: RagB/SusD family nutrient uptake outer membrane protein [Chryseosolibacter sp.]
MKRKYSLIITLMLATLIVPTACDNGLDVEPTQSLAPDQALKSEGDLVGALIGAYDGLQNTDLYGGDIQMMADIWANRYYLRFRGTFNGLLQIASVNNDANAILTNNAWPTDIWAQAYATINTCNLVLQNLALSQGVIRSANSVEGEALFIRGSLYFELARLYGKTWGDGDNTQNPAVPLVLTPTPFEFSGLDESDYPSRASVAEVYAQAKADIQRAITLLPETNQHYATKWAALVQLSRIALMQGDYATALDASNQVIASNRYTLSPVFNDLWFNYINFGGVAPREFIFYIKITTQDGTNGLNTYYGQTVSSIPGTAGRGDLSVETNWVNLHEVGDVRRTYFQSGSSSRRLTRKHLDRFGHVPVMRLAEMYLTRAEANFRLGSAVGDTPLNDINRIRTRAGLANRVTLTLDNIIRERELELAFEGHYLHDLKRTRRSAAGSNLTNGPAWNSPLLIFPVPQRERDVNTNLSQNAGY